MKALVAAVVVAATVAVPGEAATRPPRTVAVLPTASGPRLTLVDARTLRPVRHGWSLAVPVAKDLPVAFSPSRSRVAVSVGALGSDESVVVLDVATGRILRTIREAGHTSDGLYWLGGDTPRNALLVGVGFSCFSGGCGDELTVLGSGGATDYNGSAQPIVPLKEGLALVFDPSHLEFFLGDGESAIELHRMTSATDLRVVANVARDRLFAVSSAGIVAQIDNVARRPRLTYHSVPLNGRPFEAAWAGAGRIAVWGADGLGTIDTRTWTTHAIATGVTGAAATPFGIASWGDDGLAVYRPSGALRLRVLEGKPIRAARAVGPYLYVDADVRYSVDLRTGVVVGPIRSDAIPVAPSLVAIP